MEHKNKKNKKNMKKQECDKHKKIRKKGNLNTHKDNNTIH